MPHDIFPDDGLAISLLYNLCIVLYHILGVATQVEGCSGDGKKVNAMDKLGVGSKPGGVDAFAPPDHTDGDLVVVGRKYLVAHIKPILMDGSFLGGVQKNTQIADLLLAGRFPPQERSRGEVHRLGAGLLVVSVSEGTMPCCPGVSGINIMGTQKGEKGILAIPAVGIADEQVHHAAPLILRRPLRIEPCDGSSTGDGVTGVKMVIVDLRVRAISGREPG